MKSQTPESLLKLPTGGSSAALAITRQITSILLAFALALSLLLLWLLLHRYTGINNDAQVYAFQALAKLHPALATDLYLQNTSQDDYTVFSPLYAFAIEVLGLREATLMLTACFIAAFLIAAWTLARELSPGAGAWLAVGALIVTAGSYGGSGVFHFSDMFLTARMPAQALVAAALTAQLRGRKFTALSLVAIAMFIHPLMSIPGVLVLACMWVPLRFAAGAAGAGILFVLMLAGLTHILPGAARLLTVMDAPWLAVVRERSHFLFLDYWTVADWKLNAQPFCSLTLTILAFSECRIRKLCIAAALVGASGLLVALIASVVAPVAILVQGQAWRWVWMTDFICILMLAPTSLQLWKEPKCGRLCVILLVLGWTFSAVNGLACVVAALFIWLARGFISERTAVNLRWAAYGLAAVILAWILANSWTMLTSASAESGREPLFLTRIKNVVGLDVTAVILLVVYGHWLRRIRSASILAPVTACLVAACAYLVPNSFEQVNNIASPALFEEFADWRAQIPAASSVFLADKYDTGAFIWFTLERPNYLSIDQSAGVVFSRATALEIQRRSDIMLPLADRDWELLDIVKNNRVTPASEQKSAYRALTAGSLRSVCDDPQLGFVIAKENVGYVPTPHHHPGMWNDWNLYDCRRVRLRAPPA